MYFSIYKTVIFLTSVLVINSHNLYAGFVGEEVFDRADKLNINISWDEAGEEIYVFPDLNYWSVALSITDSDVDSNFFSFEMDVTHRIGIDGESLSDGHVKFLGEIEKNGTGQLLFLESTVFPKEEIFVPADNASVALVLGPIGSPFNIYQDDHVLLVQSLDGDTNTISVTVNSSLLVPEPSSVHLLLLSLLFGIIFTIRISKTKEWVDDLRINKRVKH